MGDDYVDEKIEQYERKLKQAEKAGKHNKAKKYAEKLERLRAEATDGRRYTRTRPPDAALGDAPGAACSGGGGARFRAPASRDDRGGVIARPRIASRDPRLRTRRRRRQRARRRTTSSDRGAYEEPIERSCGRGYARLTLVVYILCCISSGVRNWNQNQTKPNHKKNITQAGTHPSLGTSRGTGFELIVPLRSGPGTGSRSTMTRSTRQPYIAPLPSQS